MLIALHKPYDVLSQFTEEIPGQRTLAEFGLPPRVYPVGRLDRDSEGLLLLTDEKALVERLLHPRRGHPRVYHALVERVPDAAALEALSNGGIVLDGRPILPCRAWLPEPAPEYPDRVPPVRVRKTVTDAWLALELTEGRNRQVRRMTAAAGHPTVRLLRVRIGSFPLGNLLPGEWRELNDADRRRVLSAAFSG